MYIELPLALLCFILVFLIFFFVLKEQDEQDMPLGELAMLLLSEYQAIKLLPIEKRVEAKCLWDIKFDLYQQRLQKENIEPDRALRIVK